MEPPALPDLDEAFLLPRWWSENLHSISGSYGSHLLHLGLIRLLIRLGWHR